MKKSAISLIIYLAILSLAACGSAKENKNININTETKRVYVCDYKSLNVNTKITTVIDDKEIFIVGNIIKFLTDPLTVKDADGNILGYAGDAYGVIEQDDHGIYVDDNFEINMCGNFEMWGNRYKLKDAEGNIVATAEFNMLNTKGQMIDTNNNLVATYSSSLLENDYTVTIYDNDVCSDMSILMIMASYVSDYKADSSD